MIIIDKNNRHENKIKLLTKKKGALLEISSETEKLLAKCKEISYNVIDVVPNSSSYKIANELNEIELFKKQKRTSAK